MKYRRLIKELVPPILIQLVKRKQTRNSVVKPQYYCPICKNEVNAFLRLSDYYLEEMDKYQFIHSIFCAETLNILHYSCPHCMSSDRNRLYALYLKEQFDIKEELNVTFKFLDIAPDKTLSNWIKLRRNIEYRSVDLYMTDVDDKADITDLTIYEDERFDMILCSHVLEHIENDRKAISELHRILKNNGFAIIMAPIFLSLDEDFELPDIRTPEERWKYYGQNDHVRAYSKNGFIGKLEAAGFSVLQNGIDYFGSETFNKCGIHPRSVLYIAKK